MKKILISFLLFLIISCNEESSNPANSNGEDYSLKFNGTNSYLEFPFVEHHDLFGDFTIELWVKIESEGNGKLVSKVGWFDPGDSVSSYSIYLDEENSKNIIFSTWVAQFPNVEHKASSSISLTSQKWHHIAVTFIKQNHEKNIYIDGELAFREENTKSIGYNGRPLIVGAFKTNLDEIIFPFEGNIDELRIWGKALSDSEINTSMNENYSGNEAELLGYWDFNSGSGVDIIDRSSYKVNGTAFNTTWELGYSK